ncbi:hypothetical protein NLI96_g7512 [Meripilus lineatus]|uniref:Uncharacterized protein n=1 Tax=Meripilus lineatus TaxID=2056292 RepID=A0AAD5V3T7_9APHY|nr:hypothetical protein NLI96_g7512 [Physisporinus lineatus]
MHGFLDDSEAPQRKHCTSFALAASVPPQRTPSTSPPAPLATSKCTPVSPLSGEPPTQRRLGMRARAIDYLPSPSPGLLSLDPVRERCQGYVLLDTWNSKSGYHVLMSPSSSSSSY